MKTTTTTALWIGDNGRMTCGSLRCAGAAAHASKMRYDLSGQPMARLQPEDVRELAALGVSARCEGCGAEASLLVSVR